MIDDLINFEIKQNKSAMIKVIGIGGGGSNAINHMFKLGIKDVEFVVCNTDAQALKNSPVPNKIQLGESLTEGRGAGNKPNIGKQSAIENLQDVIDVLADNTKMVFITAGMGGGTGTGAAPVIAKAAREMGILTVAIVTLPFRFEGQLRINQAIEGLNEIKNHVDSLLVIHNEKLREIYGDLKISEAFSRADNILTTAAKGIAEIITVHGYVNVDFADVQTVMQNSGVAIMGSAIAEGENRALDAIQQALNSPLLNNNDILGAKNILLNITSGIEEVTMDEVGVITDFVTSAVAKDSLMIWGTGMDLSLGNKICVTIIATGFEANSIPELYAHRSPTQRIHLSDENKGSTVIQVKPRETHILKDEKNVFQRTIEFEHIENQDFSDSFDITGEFEVKSSKSKGSKHTSDEKKNVPKTKDLSITNFNEHNLIEDLENQPAYIRKKINVSDVKTNKTNEISKYSLIEDEEKGVQIRPDNSYLHDNVD